MTAGSLRTCVGRAFGDDRAGAEAVHAVADREHEREVVLDQHDGGVEVGLHPLDERAERLGVLLGDAGGRLVEQQHPAAERDLAGELDDAARAGGEIGDGACRA